MLDLDRGIANAIFTGMVQTRNCVIVETMILTWMCYVLNLLSHIGFDGDSLITYNVNMILYKDSNKTP